MIREISGSIILSVWETLHITVSIWETLHFTKAKGRAMCEFVVDHVDMKTMSANQKKKLATQLERRKKDLQKKVNALDKSIRKIKGKSSRP